MTRPVETSRLNTAPLIGIDDTVRVRRPPVAKTVMKRKLVPFFVAVTAVAGTFCFQPVATHPSNGFSLPVICSRVAAVPA